MTVQYYTLKNGLRLVVDPVNTSDEVSVGFYFAAGSRHEDKETNGAAHFLEHMLFKGTDKRTPLDIALDADVLGAEQNAFTGLDRTCYHMSGMASDVSEFIELLTDITTASTIPQDEMDRERGAIIEEIGMCDDDPSNKNWNNLQKIAFQDQPMGRAILGPLDNIKNFDRDTLIAFMKQHYHAGNLIVSVAGNVNPEDVLNEIETALGALPEKPKSKFNTATYNGGCIHEERQTEQIQLAISFNAAAADTKEHTAEILLTRILAGSMSARLFQEVREKRGLVYGIGSYKEGYEETGLLHIYAGTSPEKMDTLMPVIAEEIRKICDTAVTEKELSIAKKITKVGLTRSTSSVKSRMLSNAAQIHGKNQVDDIQKRIAAYDAITVQDIKDAANRVFSTTPSIATLGPGSSPVAYENFRAQLKP